MLLQKLRNSCPQLHLNVRFGLYRATVALLFLRSFQPLLLIVLLFLADQMSGRSCVY